MYLTPCKGPDQSPGPWHSNRGPSKRKCEEKRREIIRQLESETHIGQIRLASESRPEGWWHREGREVVRKWRCFKGDWPR